MPRLLPPQVLGPLCTHLAVLLQGKDKPTWAPNADLGDVCVVVNASKVVLTGNKWDDKVYSWHTGGRPPWGGGASAGEGLGAS
jgi:ribosomal protein L13